MRCEDKVDKYCRQAITYAIWTEKKKPEMQDIPTRIKEGD